MEIGTIVSAVITAVLTTLVVEYAAKPQLEARKERILDIWRRRRELQRRLTDLSLYVGVIQKSALLSDLLPARVAEDVDKMREAITYVYGDLTCLSGWIPPAVRQALASG